MPFLANGNFLFKFHFFRIYVYHPLLLLLNFLRYPKLSFKLVESILKSNSFNVYGFKIQSPNKIDRFLISNINAKFNYFILEKYEQNEKYLVEKYIEYVHFYNNVVVFRKKKIENFPKNIRNTGMLTIDKDKRHKVPKLKLVASSIISVINKFLGYLRLKPFYIGSTSQRL